MTAQHIKYPVSSFLLLVAALLLTAVPAVAAPTSRFVDGAAGIDSGDCSHLNTPCATISYALSMANDGDTIRVAEGIYKENLVIDNNNIDLLGSYLAGYWIKSEIPYSSVIDGNQLGSVVRYEDGFDGILDGFKITNGKATNGGGVYSDRGSPVLQDLWIVNNEADYGGGLFFNQGRGTVSDSKIESNTAVANGGAYFIENGRGLLASVEIKGNEAANGGGIALSNNSTIAVEDSVIRNNKGSAQSGAIHLEDSDLTIEETIIAGNQAKDHGGAITAINTELDIFNTLIYGNFTAEGPASVLAMSDSDVLILNSTIADNAPQGHQAILLWSGFLHVLNSIMWNNALNLDADPDCDTCFKVTYSDVQGHVDNPVQDHDNIDADPRFVSAGSADYHLQSSSPCIDAGSPKYAPPADLEGTVRDAKPDMGAYEYTAPVLPPRAYLPVTFAS